MTNSTFEAAKGCGCDAALAEALAAVLEQSRRDEFDIEPCMHAITVLESLPTAGKVDDRVEVALAVARCLGPERAILSLRAMAAANPAGAQICDPHRRRRWLNFSGALQRLVKNPGLGAAYLASAMELASELKDALGTCVIWSNLSMFASDSGQYADAVRFTSLAIRAAEAHKADGRVVLAEYLVYPYINRAEALHRLGRLDEAIGDAANAFTYSSCGAGDMSHMALLTLRVTALCLLARLRVQRGEHLQAELVLQAAETLLKNPEASEISRLGIQCSRGELLAARGCGAEATALLERTLAEALALDASGVTNDVAMDIMHALQRVCRAINQPRKAEMYLSKIGERLRSNANSALVALSNVPHATRSSDVATGMRNVDRYLLGLAGDLDPEDQDGASLHHLTSIAASASATDESSGEHCIRVASLCSYVARAMGLDEAAVRDVEHAGLVHDLGKVGVPPSVLTNCDSLSEQERNLLDGHAEYGAQLIERSALPRRARIAELVRLHHVWFGASDATRGSAIPIEARILSACNRFDALTTGRPRRPAVGINETLKELLEMSGSELDPRVVEVLIETVRQLQRQQDNVIDFLAAASEQYDYTSARRRLHRAAQGTAVL